MKQLIQRYQEIIAGFAQRHPAFRGWSVVLAFFAIMGMVAFGDITIKSIGYPLFFRCEEVSGEITDHYQKETVVQKRFREISFFRQYFEIDGLKIPVYNSHVKANNIGGEMTYYRYTCGDMVFGEVENYTPAKGLFRIGIHILIVFHVWILWRIPSKSEKEPVVTPKKVRRKQDYTKMKAGELYDLCLERKLSVQESRKRDRVYLCNCLRQDDRYRKWEEKNAEKDWKFYKGVLVFYIIGAILMIVLGAIVIRGIAETLM